MIRAILAPFFKKHFFAPVTFAVLYLTAGFHAQGQSVKFQHLTSNDLSGFGNVWAIAEDVDGFMWFGTEDGLYKYDGYDITPYQHNPRDSGSISGNFIVSLYEDSRHNLWIGTYGDGLNLYDRSKNVFHRFRHDPKNKRSLPNDRVKTITETQDGTLWIGTEGGGIATIGVGNATDIARGNFKTLAPDSICSGSLFIRAIVEDKKTSVLYIATFDAGICIVDRATKTIKNLRHNAKDPNSLASDKILELLLDSRNRLWIGTAEDGLDLYVPDRGTITHYRATSDPHAVCDKEIETILEDAMGRIWVGTDSGISLMNNSKDLTPPDYFENYRHEPLDEFSLLSNSVKILFRDSRNAVWAGTYFGGINVYNPKAFKFNALRSKPWISTGLSANNVSAFAEDKNGNLWIGTDGGGLNILPKGISDVTQDNYKHIPIRNPLSGKAETKIKSLAVDKNNFLWIGLWADGLYRLDPTNNRTTFMGLDDPTSIFHGTSVLQIEVDKNNNLWIGTFGDGIFYYDQQTKSLTRYQTNPNKENALTSERIRTMLMDSKGQLWIGGDVGGLNLFNNATKSFQRIEYADILTRKITILSLLESHDGKIWIGTVSSGAIIYDPETKKASSVLRDNGSVNLVISAMLEDQHGKIWMSTSGGIRVYDPSTRHTTAYTKDDGLQSNHFNSSSALKSSNGMLMFGGINGWNAFFPDSIQTDNYLPKIVFTNLRVNNKRVDVHTMNSPLTTSITQAKSIELAHGENSFSLEFASLEYNFSHKARYAYQLEPFNDQWQYIGNERKITFTNLDPGRYKLRVKATNQDGVWNETKTPLIIIIQPAWWQSNAFRVLAALAVLIAFYSVFRLRLAYLIRQRKRLTEEIDMRTAELKSKNYELAELNGEILSQNEELSAQNEQIITQREELELTHRKLEETNEHLEELVKLRTEKLEDTVRKLDKTVAELDRFVYSASHDLSAPLKSVLGLVNIAKMETDQKQIGQYYNYIEMSILKLERVIKNLVEFSRNSHLEIRLSPFKLSDLVNDVIQELAFWPEARRINIIDIADAHLELISDEQRLKVVLQNLIGNAIKYADVTKEEPYIKIDYRQKGSSWLIRISDNGIGIDERYQKKVFEMYYRATDRSQGSGLGLFIVREIVQKLGGDITMESIRGQGTEFLIELPVIKLG